MYKIWGKRSFDFIFASLGLLMLLLPLIIIGLIVKLTSKGPILFKQERVGQYFKKFKLYKFRSMVQDASQKGLAVTAKNDPRITKIGKFLRKTKLDELPQLFSVIKGELSLVGPRPEVAKYVLAAKEDYKTVLSVKPGITDLAAIKFRNEEDILAQYKDKEKAYLEKVLPEKIKLYKEYIQKMSFWYDLKLIFQTFSEILTK